MSTETNHCDGTIPPPLSIVSNERRARSVAIRSELIRQSILAFGRTAANPAVAAVLLARDGEGRYQIFSGATEIPGQRHAEIVALDAFDSAHKKRPGLRAEKLYVTLEPCTSFGKTAPCSSRILRYPDLKRIHVYAADPAQKEDGIRILREHGIRTSLHDNSRIAHSFLSGFLNRAIGTGPRLHLKMALSADGYIGARGKRVLISSPSGLAFSMCLRAKCDAVLVGPGTIAADIPSLALRAEILCIQNSLRKSEKTMPPQGDLFSRAIFKYLPEIKALITKQSRDFQPERVFILERIFPDARAFLHKQKQLEITSATKSRYLITSGYEKIWKGILQTDAIVPQRDDPSFSVRLREILASFAYNEILIEGGPALHESIAPGLREDDRIYLLQSRKREIAKDFCETCERRTEKTGTITLLKPPVFMTRATVLASYMNDEEEIIISRPAQ